MIINKPIYQELQKLKTHDYCCFIYENETEWLESIIPFLVQGLMNGDKCVYVFGKRNISYVYECLVAEGIDIAAVTGKGQLMVVDTNAIFADYLVQDIEQIINVMATWLNIFLNEGYTSIRLSSEVHFEIFNNVAFSSLLELLMRLKRDIFPYYPLAAICQYHRHEEESSIIQNAIIASGWILRAGHIYRNPNSISPDVYFVNKNIDWEVEYGLATQEALMESEEKYRQIVEHSLDMITILDAESYKITFVSPISYELLGFFPEEMIDRNVMEFIHPRQQKQITIELQEGIKLGQGGGLALIRKKDGSHIWAESKGTVIRKSKGHDEVIFFSRDVHTKKLAEEALCQSEQKYKNQVDYQNTLINTMNEFCVTYDRNTNLTFVNQRMLDATGYNNEDVLGKPILDFIPRETSEKALIQINSRLQNGEISRHENRLICKDGSELLLKMKGSPIIENGNIVGALVMAEDISQQRRLEKDMARLGQLNTVGEIAASIGHEIRNPMTTVQGFLQLLSQNKDMADYKDYFKLMLDELDRANSIITEFLDLAKDKVVNLQKSDINIILENMAPLLMADALNGDKNICFELKNVADILLDKQEIRQLILNLVRNGLEAMSPGGTISIKTTMLDDEVVLSIQDEGAGIPADMLEKLGTPFLSTKENGTGLGLAVCYSIVARHHAKLLVDSNSNGSTFNIYFPTRTSE